MLQSNLRHYGFARKHDIFSIFPDSLRNSENPSSSDLTENRLSATMGEMESIPSPHKMVEEREQ